MKNEQFYNVVFEFKGMGFLCWYLMISVVKDEGLVYRKELFTINTSKSLKVKGIMGREAPT